MQESVWCGIPWSQAGEVEGFGCKLKKQTKKKLIFSVALGGLGVTPRGCFLVHERHGTLRLIADDAGEELQRQSHVQGHEHVPCVDHHGDGREEDQVEQGFLPRLQHVDAGDEHVLVVEPGQVLPQVLYAHLARRTECERHVRTDSGSEEVTE